MPRIYSGHPIPALRPEQSDHVPWADCPQGLSSTSVRFAHPPGKSPLLPIFERGSSQCRAQWSWTAFTCSWSALVLTLFLFQKGQGFFPPLPIAALLPRSWHWADLNGGAWDASERLGWLRSAKGQRGFQIMLACGTSRRACRPTAVWACQQTGSRARPASREACRRAAVKPRPSRMSLYTPARIARSPKGAQPLLLRVMTTWRLGSSPSLWVETFSFFCRALCRMRRS